MKQSRCRHRTHLTRDALGGERPRHEGDFLPLRRAIRTGIERVAHQIEGDLAELHSVHLHRWQVAVRSNINRDPVLRGFVPQQAQDILHQGVGIELQAIRLMTTVIMVGRKKIPYISYPTRNSWLIRTLMINSGSRVLA